MLCVYVVQGCTIYKQGDTVFIGKLLQGCDAEASGMYEHLCVIREGVIE